MTNTHTHTHAAGAHVRSQPPNSHNNLCAHVASLPEPQTHVAHCLSRQFSRQAQAASQYASAAALPRGRKFRWQPLFVKCDRKCNIDPFDGNAAEKDSPRPRLWKLMPSRRSCAQQASVRALVMYHNDRLLVWSARFSLATKLLLLLSLFSVHFFERSWRERERDANLCF